MKLLLLFLISFSALASYEVKVTNNINNKKYKAIFSSETEADSWILSQKNEKSWSDSADNITIEKEDVSARESKRASRLEKIKKGQERRAKCEDILSYISGVYADSTEAQVDAMTDNADIAAILSAANSCKIKKLKRLLNEFTNIAYSDVKIVLLEILE